MKRGDNYTQKCFMFQNANKSVSQHFKHWVIYPQSAKGRGKNGVSLLKRGPGHATLTKSLHLKCWLWRSSGSFKAVQSYIIDDTNGGVFGGGSSRADVAHFKCIVPHRSTQPRLSLAMFIFTAGHGKKKKKKVIAQVGTIRQKIIFY